MPHSTPGLPGAAPSLTAAPGRTAAPARCRACQLQLCKSRREAPHAALKPITREPAGPLDYFECQTCGVVLARSADLQQPGWAPAR